MTHYEKNGNSWFRSIIHRNDECTKQRERFASLRCRLVKSLTFNKRSFLQEQKGPFSVIPLSRRVLNEKKKELNFAWREDGVLNLSGR